MLAGKMTFKCYQAPGFNAAENLFAMISNLIKSNSSFGRAAKDLFQESQLFTSGCWKSYYANQVLFRSRDMQVKIPRD